MSDTIYATPQELQQLWEAEDPDEQEFSRYFEIDNSAPFAPEIRLRENVVIKEDESFDTLGVGDTILAIVNKRTRKKRLKRYEKFILKYPDFPRIVSEGDSWFQHPMVLDTIDYLAKYYPVYSAGAAGDTLRGMHASADWMESIEKVKPKLFIMSAGGNDILGEEFPGFLNEYTPGEPGSNPERFMNEVFTREIDALKQMYEDIIEQLQHRYPDLQMISHGYDHIIPNNANVPDKWYQSSDKSWIGKYMVEKGIEHPVDQMAIIIHILGIFNGILAGLDQKYTQYHYVDLRGTIGDDQWYDEIHPTAAGYQQIEIKFLKRIRELLQ